MFRRNKGHTTRLRGISYLEDRSSFVTLLSVPKFKIKELRRKDILSGWKKYVKQAVNDDQNTM